MVDLQKNRPSLQLPTLPAIAVKLLELGKDPDSQIEDVVALIKADPEISEKILKAANSTMFGVSTKFTAVEHAVSLLGLSDAMSLAISFSLTDATSTCGPGAEQYAAYRRKSIVHATAAERLATLCEEGLGADFFLAGLLLDVGMVVMLKTGSTQYISMLKLAREKKRHLVEVEQELLGTNHVEIGVLLLKHWKLPEMMQRAVKFHHAPIERINVEKDTPEFQLIRALSVAASVGDYFCESTRESALDRLRQLTTEFYEFDDERLQELLEQINARIDETAKLFSINVDDLRNPSDLISA